MKDSQRKAIHAKKVHYLVHGTISETKVGKSKAVNITVEHVILASNAKNAKALFNVKTNNLPPAKSAKRTFR